MKEIPILKSYSRERTGQNGTREDQSSKGMEDTNKDQRCGKFFLDSQISIDILFKTSTILPNH